MKKKQLIFYLCFAVALVIGFVIVPLTNQSTRETVAVARIVGTEPIPVGTQLTADDLASVEVGAFGLPDNVARNVEDLVGQYTIAELYPGDNITTDKVSATLPEDNNLYSIVRGTCAVSVSLDTLAAGFSAKLQEGDVVSVYSIIEDDASATGISIALDPLLQYMEVLSVTNSKANSADASKVATNEEAIASTVTFRCTPNQAAKLIEIESLGSIHLTFVGRTEEAKAQLSSYNEFVKGSEQ